MGGTDSDGGRVGGVGYTVQQLADREAIRDVVTRYAHGIDRLDGPHMKSAYWPDAIDDHGSFVGNAHEFVDRCMASHGRFRSTMHCVLNHAITLDADGQHATGEVYNVTYLFRIDPHTLDTWHGRYLDRYEQRDGEWRIIHRTCVHEASTSVPMPAPMPMDWQAYRSGADDRGLLP